MSKNVTVNENDYTGVSVVKLPITGGGTANFKDVDEIITPSGDRNITENGTYDVAAFARAIVNVASSDGSSPVTTAEYEVTENADRSLWLNAQGIKLVKGVTVLMHEGLKYGVGLSGLVGGEVLLMVLLWDGVACENATINIGTAHIRGWYITASAYLQYAGMNIIAGNTSAVSVAEDGALSFTTSATGVTTGNYQNAFVGVGKYYLAKFPSDTIC